MAMTKDKEQSLPQPQMHGDATTVRLGAAALRQSAEYARAARPPAGRLLAIDIGDVRCGLAVSDPAQRVATPLGVFETAGLLRTASPLSALIEDYEVGALVIGLPLTLAGKEGPQARHVRALTKKLLAAAGPAAQILARFFVDERYSSTHASGALHEAGLSARKQRGKLDALAATLILQGFLDEQR